MSIVADIFNARKSHSMSLKWLSDILSDNRSGRVKTMAGLEYIRMFNISGGFSSVYVYY
jgi:hypothetical protein